MSTKLIIKAIGISLGHDFRGRHGKGRLDHGIQEVDEVECIAGSGLKGDRYFNFKENFKGQITFFNWDIYENVKSHFKADGLSPFAFRRNVLTQGIDLNTLIGEKFEIQGIEFEGSEECAPCYWMDEVVGTGAEDFLKGNGGLRARILTSGVLKRG